MKGEQFHVYADRGEDDPRAHAEPKEPDSDEPGESTKRGEVVRQLMDIAGKHGFEQYPRAEIAFQDIQTALEGLGFMEDEQANLFEEVLEKTTDLKFEKTINEMGNQLKQEIIDRVSEKIGELDKHDRIRLQPLEKAMRVFFIRNLEILATFQKQERQHTASHRAHSSKEGGEFVFGGPELSLEAIKGALSQGVKTIELDVAALQDGTPVVSHGLNTRTIEGRKALRDIPNIEEANNIKATIDKTGASVYALTDLFDSFEPYRELAKLNLEIKDSAAVPEIIRIIQERGLEKDVIVSAFNPQVLLMIHEALPNVQIGVNVFIDELNVGTILAKDPPQKQSVILPGNIALGGTGLPPEGKRDLRAAHYRTLPQELRDLLKQTNGYLSVQLPTAKIGFTGQLEKLQQQAKEEGINLLMFRVPAKRVQALRRHVDLLHLDKGEKLSYRRMRRKE